MCRDHAEFGLQRAQAAKDEMHYSGVRVSARLLELCGYGALRCNNVMLLVHLSQVNSKHVQSHKLRIKQQTVQKGTWKPRCFTFYGLGEQFEEPACKNCSQTTS